MSLLLLVCVFTLFSCKVNRKVEVTYNREAKPGEKDGAQIDSLKIKLVKELSNGNFLVSYSIFGQITEEHWHKSMMLKKVRLVEEENDTTLYGKHVILTPVQCSFFGKAGMYPQPFHIKNEYLIKNNLDNPIKKILFSSGDKEYLLELP
ncbi:MAG: hypothetical protein E6767_14755 [Dysgonomonas sp.]|nr:hypothetical protein [Dysgonomonas sp.]